ncbi:hypothetical protein PMAYCL1PPCAC_01400, partial [Pristionchus mayeri]
PLPSDPRVTPRVMRLLVILVLLYGLANAIVCPSVSGISCITSGDETEVTCNDSGYLFFDAKPVKRGKTTCKENHCWNGTEVMEKDPEKEFDCKTPAAELCKFRNFTGDVKFDSTTRTLNCTEKDGEFVYHRFISVNSKRYKSITCDPYYDWFAENKENIADASKELNVTCVEFRIRKRVPNEDLGVGFTSTRLFYLS